MYLYASSLCVENPSYIFYLVKLPFHLGTSFEIDILFDFSLEVQQLEYLFYYFISIKFIV